MIVIQMQVYLWRPVDNEKALFYKALLTLYVHRNACFIFYMWYNVVMFPCSESQANDIIAEEKAYKEWEKKHRNWIFSLSSEKRKQEEWKKLYPQRGSDDSYLDSTLGIW